MIKNRTMQEEGNDSETTDCVSAVEHDDGSGIDGEKDILELYNSKQTKHTRK